MNYSLPSYIVSILTALKDSNFEAYIVGGSVRDLLLNKPPKDFDIATNAKPDQIQKLFPDSVYENKFGTVGVKVRHSQNQIEIVEITTYRKESTYSDNRRPDQVNFVETLQEDLSRRDFTINALALDQYGTIYDFFNGQKDLQDHIIRTVGDPDQRFQEDALRLMRAIRFACQLDFQIEPITLTSIHQHADLIKHISAERIRDEFSKIIMSKKPMYGIELLEQVGLLTYFFNELREGLNCGQNKHHIYTVWEHNLRALQYAADQNYDLTVRLSSLLHDVGKPRSKQGDGYNSTFYQHDIIGAPMAYEMLMRLKYPKAICAKVSKLVRYHLFFYDVDLVTESSIRKLLRKVGPENMKDLIKVREGDRIGSGTPKAKPYRLRHFEYMIDKVMTQPISVSMLKINGTDLMNQVGVTPGPKIGAILNALLAQVLENPELNTLEYLVQQAQNLKEQDLKDINAQAKELIQEKNQEQELSIKQKFWVK